MSEYCEKCGWVTPIEQIIKNKDGRKITILKCPICGNYSYLKDNKAKGFLINTKTRRLKSTAYSILMSMMPDSSKGFYVQAAYATFRETFNPSTSTIKFHDLNHSNLEGIQEFIKFLLDESNKEKIKENWWCRIEEHTDNKIEGQRRYEVNKRNWKNKKPWYSSPNVSEEVEWDYLDPTLYY